VPPSTPDAIRTLIARCVARMPSGRPTFDEIAEVLTAPRTIHAILSATSPRGDSSDSQASDRTDPRPIGRLRKGAPTTGRIRWDAVKAAVKAGGGMSGNAGGMSGDDYQHHQFTASFRTKGATGRAEPAERKAAAASDVAMDSLPAADPFASMGTFFKSIGASFFGRTADAEDAAHAAEVAQSVSTGAHYGAPPTPMSPRSYTTPAPTSAPTAAPTAAPTTTASATTTLGTAANALLQPTQPSVDNRTKI